MVLYQGDVIGLITAIPDNSISLVITSPPYNLGKDYEDRVSIETYLETQSHVIVELCRVRERLDTYFNGTLKIRPMGKPIHQPTGKEKITQIPDEWKQTAQPRLAEKKRGYK